MKKIYLILLIAAFIPLQLMAQDADIFRQEGIASWYGREFEGRPTASGEIYDSSLLTAAHPSLPFGTIVVVTNTHNNKKVTVRINDRGPFVAARIIDVSRAAAEQLDMVVTGTAPVLVESIEMIAISPIINVQPSSTLVSDCADPATNNAEINTAAFNSAPPLPATVFVSQPVVTPAPVQLRLTPQIVISPDKTYRLQVGSFRVARNAVEAFERCKNSGLNPAYERHSNGNSDEYFRVVIAGIRGSDVHQTTEKLGAAGFREALIREEN